MTPTVDRDTWPPRPPGEVFPPVLDTLLAGQLLLHDRQNMTPDQWRRNVRLLVKNKGLPTLKRVGRGLLFGTERVLSWLAGEREADPDGGEVEAARDAD